jgi:uncharacterized protein (DUF885 family)
LPEGETFYAQAMQFHLGAPVAPHQAHAEARAHAARLQNEADTLLRAQGLTQGDVSTRLRALARDPRQLYPAGDRDAPLADMRASLETIRRVAAPAFAAPLPAADVRPLPAAEEANGARGRRENGAYIVDLGGSRPRWTLPSVVAHETLPGPLLQADYEARVEAPALQRRYAGGYSEGWATYAEMLTDDLGAYSGDPLARVGFLQWTLFRLARIVVDTGMHALRWSRTQAIAEMRALQGDSIAFVSIEEDVGRIAAQPGVAAAQGLAALRIAELRVQYAARRGFTLPAFHDAMLRRGPLSPTGLAQAADAAFGAR